MPNRHQSGANNTQKSNAGATGAVDIPTACLKLTEEERQTLARITSSTTKTPVEINQEIFRFWMAKRQQGTEDASE